VTDIGGVFGGAVGLQSVGLHCGYCGGDIVEPLKYGEGLQKSNFFLTGYKIRIENPS